ncbi:TniB family NTP-binding protein [Pseudomonas syringae]|nr:TniB family NTP-binding protein [Pseudomonas syringae]
MEHPQFKGAVHGILESLDNTAEMDDPASAMLLGLPGTGKSRVCARVQEQMSHPGEQEDAKGLTKIIPCLYCRVPAHATIKELSLTMLHDLGSNATARESATMQHTIVRLLKTCQTRLVILDEFQHLAEKGADKTRAIMCDWVKTLLNESGIPVLLAGTPAFEKIADNNAQLSQRYPCRLRMENFRYGPAGANIGAEWRQVLAKLTSEMIRLGEIQNYIFLSDDYFALATYIYTGGNMRGLRHLLHAAFKSSLNRGDHTLIQADFLAAADRLTFLGQIKLSKNPFAASEAELHKILHKLI